MSIPILSSYILGNWETGKSNDTIAVNAVTQTPICTVSSDGFDFADILNYARKSGSALRTMTFHARANCITALAKHLKETKKSYYPISAQTGATLKDSKIDIDGGINTLLAMASMARRGLPDATMGYEPDYDILSPKGGFVGKHLLVSKPGVAVLINAFNFPCWGMLEKLACAFIAGMPVIVKPASASGYVAEAMMRDIIASDILPAGSIQIINGRLGDMLSHLQEMDVVSFTGSADTARHLRQTPVLAEKSIPFYAEADSLNFAMLSAHAVVGDDEFNACADEVANELATKAGQRCTCIRRIFVPQAHTEALGDAIMERLQQKIIGNPENPDTHIGALVSREQQQAVQSALEKLLTENTLYAAYEGEIQSEYAQQGNFFRPHLLLDDKPFADNRASHNIEAFGPVATLLPYQHIDDTIAGICMARGSLTGTLYSNDADETRAVVAGVGAWHGRLNIVNGSAADENPGHGNVMPQMVHGGPGRAGGSEELGGIRGIKHYLQRVGVQGDPTLISKLCGDWCAQAPQQQSPVHPFRLLFDEIAVGQGIKTHGRTVTETDIVNFGCLTWDHFYAHFDEEAAQRSFFKRRVAHGYFVLSATAGLFVDPAEGPILVNAGIEQLRFLTPVYPGDTIRAQLTCKEKTFKPHRNLDMPPAGEVKWHVQTLNQNNEVVADYTILTLVRRKPRTGEICPSS